MNNTQINIVDWGTVEYGEALERQTELYEKAKELKNSGKTAENNIIICQHPHVYTIGKSGKDSNMLISEAMLKHLGINFFHIKRGGDITYHGPGQIVVYPIIDLEQFGLGLKEYVFTLEEAVIRTCAEQTNLYGCGIDIMPGDNGCTQVNVTLARYTRNETKNHIDNNTATEAQA